MRLVVFDLSSTPYLDLSALQTIGDLHRELTGRGITMRIAEATSAVRDSIRKDGLEKELGLLGPGMSLASVIGQWQMETPQ